MKVWLALLLGLLVAPPVAAQRGDMQAMSMEIQNNAGREPMGDPRQTHDAALCYAQHDGGSAILREVPHSRRESRFVGGAFISESPCHPDGRRLLVGGRFLRGVAAEFLLTQPRGPRTDVAVFPMPNADALQRLEPNVRAPIIFIQIGECAARANPAGVTALLAAEVGTPEERAAFATVVPSLGNCVPPGVSFTLPPLLIRGYLAEGAYRNAVAARAGNN